MYYTADSHACTLNSVAVLRVLSGIVCTILQIHDIALSAINKACTMDLQLTVLLLVCMHSKTSV